MLGNIHIMARELHLIFYLEPRFDDLLRARYR